LADDHAPIRAGIRAALEGHGFAIAAEVSSGECAVEAALRERPDLCLLDIQMPGGGIQAAAEIGLELPDTAIVMLTVSTDEDDPSPPCAPGRAATCSRTPTPNVCRSLCATWSAAAKRPSRASWSRV
jgi:DNA-binding NarL/FixJ family response regulator